MTTNRTIAVSPAPRTLNVLALGDTEHVEFAGAGQLLGGDDWVAVTEAGGESWPTDARFDLVLFFQSRPGSIDARLPERIRHTMPLAGMVVLLGTWCEGETRTGRPLPFCERLFWYQFALWWHDVRRDWTAGRPTSWQRVASEPVPAPAPSGKLILIDTTDADTAEAIIVACESLGHVAVWSPRHRQRLLSSPPAAAIWVGGQLSTAEAGQLAAFKQSLGHEIPLVVLLDFPRIDRTAHARQLGATTVLGKPWRIEHLATALSPLTIEP